MAFKTPYCSECGLIFSSNSSKCPECGHRNHKSIAEAYSGSGLGLFDLIPGIRDLSDSVRYALMLTVVVTTVTLLILGPRLYRLYQQFA